MQTKNAAIETSANPQPVPIHDSTTVTTDDNTKNYSIFWPPIGMAYNRYCDNSGKVYKSSDSANIPLNVNGN